MELLLPPPIPTRRAAVFVLTGKDCCSGAAPAMREPRRTGRLARLSATVADLLQYSLDRMLDRHRDSYRGLVPPRAAS